MPSSDDLKLLLVIKARNEATEAFATLSKQIDGAMSKMAAAGKQAASGGGLLGAGVGFLLADKTIKDLTHVGDAMLAYREKLDGAHASMAELSGEAARQLPDLGDMVQMWDSLGNATVRYNQVREIERLNNEALSRTLITRIAAMRDEAREMRGLSEYEAALHTIEKKRIEDLNAIAAAGRRGALAVQELASAEAAVQADAADQKRMAALKEIGRQVEKNNAESGRAMARRRQLEDQAAAQVKAADEKRIATTERVNQQILNSRREALRAEGRAIEATLEEIKQRYQELRAGTQSPFERSLLDDAEAADVLVAKLSDAKGKLAELQGQKAERSVIAGGVQAAAAGQGFSGIASRFASADQQQLAELRGVKDAVNKQEKWIARIEEMLRGALAKLNPIFSQGV